MYRTVNNYNKQRINLYSYREAMWYMYTCNVMHLYTKVVMSFSITCLFSIKKSKKMTIPVLFFFFYWKQKILNDIKDKSRNYSGKLKTSSTTNSCYNPH